MTSKTHDVREAEIPGLYIATRRPFMDNRGSFERIFCGNELEVAFGTRKIAQINLSSTSFRGTIRGLHFQKGSSSEAKYVSCLHGEVFDVAVDIRPNSATYLKWHAEFISAENKKSIFIPEGFAHGFQALTDNVKLLYLHTSFYDPSLESGLHPYDPLLSIKWPLSESKLSQRDMSHEMLNP